jgi:virginiamycin B lyase
MPFSATPDKDGYLWIPNSGRSNRITRLNPRTGEMVDFMVPYIGTAGIHSTIPAPDGSVWIAEQGSNRVGRWDPRTQKIIEYQDAYVPGKEGLLFGGQKHTLRLDPSGNVWSSGIPLTKFDPETGRFTRFTEVAATYDVKPDKDGDVWFTNPSRNSIGKVDGKTMKVTQWVSPTVDSYPRRVEIGDDGMIYSGEFKGGKMMRFDPNTQTIQEFPLPGPDPSPYALGVDAQGYIWYDSHHMDNLGRFDPKTGTVIEYPFPHFENCAREFFRDREGHMWYGSSPNNKVGYFYLTGKSGEVASK